MSHVVNGYGLCLENPVLCGGGPEGERRYLKKLRCPDGHSVRFNRQGSTSLAEQQLMNALHNNGGSINDIMANVLSGKHHSLDVYEVACEGGDHHAKVYMNMYETKEDACIGLPGWSLAD